MRRALLSVLALLSVAAQDARRAPPSPPLDAFFEAEWKAKGLKPAAPCEDAVFLRRVTLDLTGTLPDPEDSRTFLKAGKGKRPAKIDELLASPKSAEYFAYLWIQWLMGYDIEFRDVRRLDLGALARWLKAAWTNDMPYEDMVRAFLSSTGSLKEAPAANFMAKHLPPGDPPAAAAGATAKLFLGKEIRCAQCHDHPFEKVTQEEFWSFAAFLRPLELREGALAEGSVVTPSKLRDDMGEQFAEPKFLDGREPGKGEVRSKAFARLALTMEGEPTSRAIADRFWKLFFGRSIAPGRNSKGYPELLQLLVEQFQKGKGSLKSLVRTIVSSRAYQLSSEGAEATRREYAVGPLKMMNTVQFLKTWNHALALDVYYRQLYEKDPQRAAFFADPDVFWVGQSMYAKELLFPKGRDPEESLASGTDRLALKLMNNRDLQLLMAAQFGLVRKVLKNYDEPGRRIEELFLMMVSRPPTAREKSKFVEHVRGFSNPYMAYTDVLWTLFNSSEFVFVG